MKIVLNREDFDKEFITKKEDGRVIFCGMVYKVKKKIFLDEPDDIEINFNTEEHNTLEFEQ